MGTIDHESGVPTLRVALGVVVATLSIAVAVALAGPLPLVANFLSSCGVVEEAEIVESDEFTPADVMLSQLPETPLVGGGGPPPSDGVDAPLAPGVVDGLPVQWVRYGANGAVYQYFLLDEVPADMTPSGFLTAGGIQLETEPLAAGSFAEHLLATEGDRAVA